MCLLTENFNFKNSYRLLCIAILLFAYVQLYKKTDIPYRGSQKSQKMNIYSSWERTYVTSSDILLVYNNYRG